MCDRPFLDETRYRVISDYLRSVLDCEHFDIRILDSGYSRKTFVVQTEAQNRFILQVSAGATLARNNYGVAFNKLLHDAGGSAPEVISGPDRLDELRMSACVYGFLNGEHRKVLTAEEAYELGLCVGRMHRIMSDVKELELDQSDSVKYRLTFRSLRFRVKNHVLRGMGFLRMCAAGYIRPALATLGSRSNWIGLGAELAHVYPSGYNHGDLKAENILFADESTEVRGMIDFEKVQYRPYIFDIAEVLCLTVCRRKSGEAVDYVNLNRFMQGYQKERSLTDQEIEKLPELLQLRIRLFVSGGLIQWARGDTQIAQRRLQYAIKLMEQVARNPQMMETA